MFPSFKSYTLKRLVELIVCQSSPEALEELHSHRLVCSVPGKNKVRIAEYLLHLRGESTDRHLQQAYDLTVSKFSSFPNENSDVDCRKYFKPLFKYQVDTHPLVEDQVISEHLQRLILKQFKLSCKEAYRTNDNFSRYIWKVNSHSISLQFPRLFSGSQRRKWLNEQYPESSKISPKMKSDIQARIDAKFADTRTVALTEKLALGISDLSVPMPYEVLDSNNFRELPDAVAKEKCERIQEQRPAIRALGEMQLNSLVLLLFERIIYSGMLSDSEIAQKFNLTKATLSRFGGFNSREKEVPDLWKNTLEVISHSPVFSEIFDPNLS